MKKLSVVIPTFNEEKNIGKCLDSVKDWVNEIVIIDANSKDSTKKILVNYSVKLFTVENQRMFHKNKQYGLDKAKGEWILQLDADEIVPNSLKQEIITVVKQDNQTVNGYYIPRKNYFLGRWMKKGGLYPDGVVRLIRKGKGYFPCESVHEQIHIQGKVTWLKNPLLHHPYHSISEYLVKANRYTTLTAEDLNKKNIHISLFNTFRYCFVIPFKTFFNIFIRHLGFLDGFYGFIWACLSSTHFFLAYAKLLRVRNS